MCVYIYMYGRVGVKSLCTCACEGFVCVRVPVLAGSHRQVVTRTLPAILLLSGCRSGQVNIQPAHHKLN